MIRKLAVHGLAVELRCEVGGLEEQLEHDLGEFAVPDWPGGFTPAVGWIRPFEQAEVLRSLSPTARRIAGAGGDVELYEEGERFWAIDERFGLSEINLLKSQWRTWLLPKPIKDPVRLASFAALWPMAQILRGRGLHLLPGAAVSRAGTSWLILSPYNLEGELETLVRAGYRVIGQSWAAVRQENHRIELLHMPGQVERPLAPRLRKLGEQSNWVDLMREHCGAEQRYGFCSAVMIIEPGRRAERRCRALAIEEAARALRAAWPIAELHPQRRHGSLAAQLAHHCACFSATLTRSFGDLRQLMGWVEGRSRAAVA